MATMTRFTHSRQPVCVELRMNFRLFITDWNGSVRVSDFPSFISLSRHLSDLMALGSVDTYFVRKLNN